MDEHLLRLLLPTLKAERTENQPSKQRMAGDEGLILPLILLLMAEGQDKVLLLALVFILS